MHVSSTSILDCVISQAIYASKSSPPSVPLPTPKVAHQSSYSLPYIGIGGKHCQPTTVAASSIYHHAIKRSIDQVFLDRDHYDDDDDEDEEENEASVIHHCSADADSTHFVPIKSIYFICNLVFLFVAIQFNVFHLTAS